MNSIQVADQTFVVAPAAQVAAAINAPEKWRRWWPDLRLTVREDRGPKGIRWTVDGALTGTMEVWLEPSLDGVIVHYFLHAEPNGPSRGSLAEQNRRRRVAGKNMTFELKATLEAGRRAGEPPRASAQPR
ncbi:polyketide cyclase / dehydrase and lipid transport [Skermania sp. ID1734]|uniref:polyketide cyclase / dehydrase and lipid transport n=1 Tax=Skermania sp. ID1734 TaxID=2597516 RepID=UPI001180DF3A|nr:polyketide cyclase / dehydrase and lipid transport [Skermania sp. ID1734]TSE01196.1 polyketide cyclase / dehydrase and lipid transport [Skermania sp. ID1734]